MPRNKETTLNHHPTYPRSAFFKKLTSILVIVVGLNCGSVLADQTLKSNLKITKLTVGTPTTPTTAGSPQPSSDPQITDYHTISYFKDGDARTELGDSLVTIYKGGEGKIYTLNPTAKTYYFRTLRELAVPPKPSTSRSQSAMKLQTDLIFNPGPETQKFLGYQTNAFVLSGKIIVEQEQPQRPSQGNRGGGRRGRGGGGLGGGGLGGGGLAFGDQGPSNNAPAMAPVEYQISGDSWLSDSVKLPKGKGVSLLPLFYDLTPIDNYLLQPIMSTIGKKGVLPLSCRVSVASPWDQGTQKVLFALNEVTDISTQTLSDTLFKIPVGYTLVSPPVNSSQ